MKKGTKTEMFDSNDIEISMGDKLILHDPDGRKHIIKVDYAQGMFVEDGTLDAISMIMTHYPKVYIK